MKILQVHTRYRERGGEDAVVAAEAEVLRAAGHEVVQHLVDNPPTALAAARSLAAAPRNPAAAQRLAHAARRVQPDVAHVHNTWFALSPGAFTALRRQRIPVVATLHNYRLLCGNAMLFRDGRPCEDCVGSHPWHGVVHRCYRGSAAASLASAATIAANRTTWRNDVDLFLALTEFGLKRFVAGGLPADKLQVKSNFVPEPGPRPQPPSQSREVLFVGRLSPEKGVRTLLEAWRRAQPPFELVIIGDGPERASLQRDAPSGVRFAGRLRFRSVRTAMLQARALVFPSIWYEGQGMTLLESLASGLPAFVSDLGGSADVLREGGGWRVPPADVDAWADVLAQMLPAGDALDAASAIARERYESAFTPERGLAGLEAAYRRVIDDVARKP